MSVLNQFNSIATVYDRLAAIALLGSIRKSQLSFIDLIPNDSDVLILGGGTGWILEEIALRNKKVRVCYVEASSKMIDLSKRRDECLDILFIHGTESDIPTGAHFDVIITNFYLDLFPKEKLESVIEKLGTALKPRGIWLISEFVSGLWWKNLYLRLMYLFFRISCGLRTYGLPPWRESLLGIKLQRNQSKHFLRGFIESSVWSRDADATPRSFS